MTETDDNIVDLADLSADVVRARNDDIDAELSAKEDRISELESTVEEKNAKVASLKDERDAAKDLLSQFQEAQRSEAKERLASALPDDANLEENLPEDASVDTMHWLADMIESAGSTPSKTASKSPDLSQVQGDGDVESRKAELAEEMGMGDAYEKTKSGSFGKPEGFEVNTEAESASKQELLDGLEEVMN